MCILCAIVHINTGIEAKSILAKYIWAVQNAPEQCALCSGRQWGETHFHTQSDVTNSTGPLVCTVYTQYTQNTQNTQNSRYTQYTVPCTLYCVRWAGWLSHWHSIRPGSWGHTWHFCICICVCIYLWGSYLALLYLYLYLMIILLPFGQIQGI